MNKHEQQFCKTEFFHSLIGIVHYGLYHFKGGPVILHCIAIISSKIPKHYLGFHAKIITRWDYQAVSGGDTHYSLFRGTKASVEIRQGKEENYLTTLYIKPNGPEDATVFSTAIQNAVASLNKTHDGITVEKSLNGWKLVIPQTFKIGHEAHFAQVMQRYLQYLNNKKLPDWEVPNMLAKYYTSTKAVEMATK